MNAITPTGSFKVNPHAGGHDGRASSEWFNRPDDQRFLDLDSLLAATSRRRDASRVHIIDSTAVRVQASRDNAAVLTVTTPHTEAPLSPTHWSFGQMASLVDAPAGYLRRLPGVLAAINLQHGFANHRAEQIKTLQLEDGTTELRAVTGPQYGRIFDAELVECVQRIAGNGTGDSRWKIPGQIDWATSYYNPNHPITKESTTLYASDRDVFMFLVDDRNPIEAGRLADGSPDLYFRGFYCWNSEVGSRTLGFASFYLRAVCQNRNIWGQEQFEQLTIRHSKNAADKFEKEARPALEAFADSSPGGFISGIQAARQRVVARSADDRRDFLRGRNFTEADTSKIIRAVLEEEGREPESIFDFVQGITAVAREIPRQDDRVEMERKAKKLFDKVAA